ncbi:hypothetical protein CS343_15135 [Bordetella bronchiseptica]|nr:hypothetical protein CS343_15135 [Bordetella bronchiseptica]
MATLPSYVRILLPGYAERPDYGVLRTDMDGGIAKQRPQYTTPIVTREVTLQVPSRVEKLSFDAWFGKEIAGGSDWFLWEDPIDGVVKQGRIVGGALQWTSPGRVWRAAVQLETVG